MNIQLLFAVLVKYSFSKQEVKARGVEVTIDELRRKFNESFNEAPKDKGNVT